MAKEASVSPLPDHVLGKMLKEGGRGMAMTQHKSAVTHGEFRDSSRCLEHLCVCLFVCLETESHAQAGLKLYEAEGDSDS